MSYEEMSPLSHLTGDDLYFVSTYRLANEIMLFRKALQYCYDQKGDDNCWMDSRHLLMRFLPGYDPATDDVTLAEKQKENCDSFIECFQKGGRWECRGGDRGKTIWARITGTLDCLKDK